MLLAAAPAPWRVSAAAELLDDLERQRRPVDGLPHVARDRSGVRADRPARARHAYPPADRGGRGRALGAPVLRAWASVLRTAVAVRQGATGGRTRGGSRAAHGAAGLGLSHAPEAAELIGQGRTGRARHRIGRSATDGPPTSGPDPGVSLRCLGGFSLAAAGVELPWRELRPRVRALLMLLAMNHGRQLHREQLVDALWPDATLASGIRSLQVAVSSIRQCLGAAGITEDALRRHGDAYALQLPGASDQLADFERLAHAAGREQGAEALRSRLAALDRYAGDLLPEVGPAEWVVEERNRLRLLAASVGSAAARDALAAGRAADRARRGPALGGAGPVPRLVLAAGGGDQRAARRSERGRGRPAGAGPGLGRPRPGRARRRGPSIGRAPLLSARCAAGQRRVQKGRVIDLALSPSGSITSPSLTRVSQRSYLEPAGPSADLRLEMINRFLLSGDQMGLKSVRRRRRDLPLAGSVGVHHVDVEVAFRRAVGNPAPEGDLGRVGRPGRIGVDPGRRVGQLLRIAGADHRQRVQRAAIQTARVARPVQHRLTVRRDAEVTDHLVLAGIEPADQPPIHADDQEAVLVLAHPATDQHHVGVGQAPGRVDDVVRSQPDRG